MLETCRLKSREPTWFHEPHQGLRLLPSTIVAGAAVGLAGIPGFAHSYLPGGLLTPARTEDRSHLFLLRATVIL